MTPQQIDDMAIAEMKYEMGGAWMASSWEVASPWVKDRLRIKALSKALAPADNHEAAL